MWYFMIDFDTGGSVIETVMGKRDGLLKAQKAIHQIIANWRTRHELERPGITIKIRNTQD